MNKKISLSVLNSTIVALFLIFVSFGIVIWAYSYINKQTKTNIEEYFFQTSNLIDLIIENEQKYLNDVAIEISNIIYSKNLSKHYDELENELNTIKSIEQIDLLFVKSENEVYDFSNSLFDTSKIINKLLEKRITYNNIIISVKIENENFPMLLSQKKIEDKNTGRIKDIIYVAKILNDNFSFINNIKIKSKLQEVYIYFEDDLISLTGKEELKNLNFSKSSSFQKNDLSYYNRALNIYENKKLDLILVLNNNSFNTMRDFFISQMLVIFIFILLSFLIFYIISKKLIINPFSDLILFAKKIKKDKNTEIKKTNIYEFDKFSKDLKTIIDELRDVKEQYISAIDGVQDGLWDIDLKTKKVFFSNQFKKMIGYDKDDNINNIDFIFKSICKKDLKKTFKLLKTHFKKESSIFENDYKFRCKDGKYKHLKVRGKVFFDENNQAVRISGFHTDIDEIVKLQDENSKKEQMLQQQSKLAAMGELIGNIAHQWRQPLTVISVNASMIEMRLHNKDINRKECSEDLESLVDTVQYLSSIIEKFMRFFNPNNKIEEFDLKQSIEENIEIFEVSYKLDNINLHLDIENIVLKGTKFELIQVLLNLINNSTDALKKVDYRRDIFISAKYSNSSILISVKDNGGGISKDISNRIYEPYFTTKHKSQGTGLGLYMSNEIITKNFNGKLYNRTVKFNYENEDFVGEEFIIEIPAK